MFTLSLIDLECYADENAFVDAVLCCDLLTSLRGTEAIQALLDMATSRNYSSQRVEHVGPFFIEIGKIRMLCLLKGSSHPILLMISPDSLFFFRLFFGGAGFTFHIGATF